MEHTTYFVCLVSSVSGCYNALGRGNANSGHITNLDQSTFLRYLWVFQMILVLLNVKGLYSEQFIFFLTYEWAQSARVLHYIRLERLARGKHCILLGPFMSYKKLKCCENSLWGLFHNTLFSSQLNKLESSSLASLSNLV
jgi:hypothetical protein